MSNIKDFQHTGPSAEFTRRETWLHFSAGGGILLKNNNWAEEDGFGGLTAGPDSEYYAPLLTVKPQRGAAVGLRRGTGTLTDPSVEGLCLVFISPSTYFARTSWKSPLGPTAVVCHACPALSPDWMRHFY